MRPGLQCLSNDQYNQLFTMHGTAILLLHGQDISASSMMNGLHQRIFFGSPSSRPLR
jgi:heme/copper-type cytochrome/quinol oxidase subunit 1